MGVGLRDAKEKLRAIIPVARDSKVKIAAGEKESEHREKERKLQAEEREAEFSRTFNSTVAGALTIVAGLFWQDLTQDAINLLFPEFSENIGAKLIRTAFITAAFTLYILHMNREDKKKLKALEEKKKALEDEMPKAEDG
jgi:hypothetical protein